MASISANGSKGHHKFTLTVTEKSTSAELNTSTISYSFQLSPITKGYDWYNWTNPSRTISYTVNINGTAYTGTIPNYDGSSTVTLKSGTQTVSHNTDGTKKISYSFSVTDTAGQDYTSGNASASGEMTLTALTRPATGAAPTINTTRVMDTNATTVNLTGSSDILVRYHSTVEASMTATPQSGASIKAYTIKNGSRTGTGSTCTFSNVDSNIFTFSAEDNKGYVGTKTVTANMVDYVRLTCNMVNSRPNASGQMTLSCFGNYFNGSFGSKSNTLTVQYSYTSAYGNGSGSMTVSKSGNTYTAYASLSGLNYETTYSFVITATDKLETVTSRESGVKSKPIFHWGENDFAFEVPVHFNSTDEMRIKGDLWLKGDGNYGRTLYFGDKNQNTGAGYCYISEPFDDVMNIYASNGLQINGNFVYGEWTPTLYEDAVSSCTAKGWYQRLGNVVTIGWYIEAYITSGFNNTLLEISGIPETLKPAVSAFGGGLAIGPYITANHAFECWRIGSDSKITARTQPCDNTALNNLNVGSKVYYPSGGGPIKLSGTICYMTS